MGIYEKALEIQTQVNQIKTNLDLDASAPLSEVVTTTASGGGKIAPPFISFYKADHDISEFVKQIDISNMTRMSNMFANIAISNTDISLLDLSHFNTSNVQYFYEMFFGSSGIRALDVSNWDMSSCVNNSSALQSMFSSMSNLVELDLSTWKNFKPQSLYNFFYYCTSLQWLDLSSFDTSELTDVRQMFRGCTKLIHLDLRSWVFDKISSSYAGAYWSAIPSNCEIIVKDETAKTYLTTQNSAFTNIYTLDEWIAAGQS